jgi:hypothetical protein
VLIIDELALLSPGGKDAYQRVKALTYMFGAGVETSRSRQSAFAVPPASAAWRSILVSADEHSIAALRFNLAKNVTPESLQGRMICLL